MTTAARFSFPTIHRAAVRLNTTAMVVMAACAVYQVIIAVFGDPTAAVDELFMACAWALLSSINVTLFFFLKSWRQS